MTKRHEWSPERLARLLEAYGSDTARWPAGADAGLAAYLALEPAARRAMAEAQALDRLLAQAPAAAGGAVGLSDRILARVAEEAARKQPAAEERSEGRVIAWPGARSRAGAARSVAAAGAPWTIGRKQVGAAAGLLAASLVLGFYLGAAGLARPALDPRGAVAEVDGDQSPAQMLLQELTDAQDEDVL
jgi:hypothetical protein